MGGEMIRSFAGENRFLSNFFPAEVVLDRISYRTIEHAYQAAKSIDPLVREQIQKAPSPGKAKALGKKLDIRTNWEEIKIGIMRDLIQQKFANHELRERLIATQGEIIEGNTWGDTFWGVCDGKGRNILGILLMEEREKLLKGEKS